MSSFVNVVPEELASASEQLSGIGSSIKEAASAAAPSTTSVVAAAEDEVSAAISKLFGGYGQEFQALSAQAGQFHSSFLQTLTSGGNAYAAAEVGGSDLLQNIVDFAQPFGIFSPVKSLTGTSLFVNGATGAAGTAGRAPMAVTARGAVGLSATAVLVAPGRLAPARMAVTAGRRACGALAVLVVPAGPGLRGTDAASRRYRR